MMENQEKNYNHDDLFRDLLIEWWWRWRQTLGNIDVVFENWSCDKFSGINVTTGSIQEECTNNIPYKFTRIGYINCFKIGVFFLMLRSLLFFYTN